MGPRNDIGIYAPHAFVSYERGNGPAQASPLARGGGAELQTALLAAQLANRGFQVGHIVFPVKRPVELNTSLEIVEHRRPQRRRWVPRSVTRIAPLWRALVNADARLYIFRGGGSMLLVIGAAFCLVHRRRFVHSISNDFDLIVRRDRSRIGQALNRRARRRAQLVVVQTEQQGRLAREALADSSRVRLIRSFAEPAPQSTMSPPAEPAAFLWAGRVVSYKLPLRYVELARAVPSARFEMVAATTDETAEPLAGELVRAARDVDNLKLMPRQAREQVLQLIDGCIAVVLTSRFEGMPNVFLEAWARGVPVLSLHFDPDGLIEQEGLGIFAGGSWERFIAGAETLRDNPELRAEIGARARSYIEQAHSPDAIGELWARAVREALAD